MRTASPQNNRAFTLMELLVAMVIMLIMITLVYQIFSKTSQAVGVGVTTSDMVNSVAAMKGQLQRDFSRMLGPHEPSASNATGGILIIINRRIDNVPVGDISRARKIDDEPVLIADDGGKELRSVRSDQLVFIGDMTTTVDLIYPITPSTNSTYVNNNDVQYARFWLGHVRRTDPVYWDDPSHDDYSDKNYTQDHPEENGALGRPGLNELANNWILGRQTLFLNDNSAGNSGVPTIHTTGGWFNAPRQGDVQAPVAVQPQYMGSTDTASFTLQDSGSTAGTDNGMLVGESTSLQPGTAVPSATLWSVLPDAQYRQRAHQYTYGIKRLRVKPMPEVILPSEEDPNGMIFESWQVGQMHPVFIRGVSDFIVEFAADVDSAIVGEPDVDGEGNLIWYAHEAPLPDTLVPPPTYDAYDGGGTSMPHADGLFVWRHDDDDPNDSLWPYLIRIRWRMHDPRGKMVGINGEPGRWFELILKVNRPQP